jgi:hypothetical protein
VTGGGPTAGSLITGCARRGHRFCRYADDCNIYVRSRRAGERVMASVSRFLTQKLRLKVNEAKSEVARPQERKFLGFSISNDGGERRIASKALDKFKTQIRDLTRWTRGIILPHLIEADAIPHRMARLLQLLPDTTGAHQPGSVASPKTTIVSLAPVAERAQSLQRTAPSWRAKVPCSGRRRFADGALAHVRTPGGPTSPAQPLFRLTRSAPTPCLCPSLTQSNRHGTDPYARWWGRGGIARCPPYPDQ